MVAYAFLSFSLSLPSTFLPTHTQKKSEHEVKIQDGGAASSGAESRRSRPKQTTLLIRCIYSFFTSFSSTLFFCDFFFLVVARYFCVCVFLHSLPVLTSVSVPLPALVSGRNSSSARRNTPPFPPEGEERAWTLCHIFSVKDVTNTGEEPEKAKIIIKEKTIYTKKS